MILGIQSNIPGRQTVWLVKPNGQMMNTLNTSIVHHGSDKLLALVARLLKKQRAKLSTLTKIVVVRGPGPFTAVRTGLVIANTLHETLGIPIKGIVSSKPLTPKKIRLACMMRFSSTFVRPFYGREPNITRPRKH